MPLRGRLIRFAGRYPLLGAAMHWIHDLVRLHGHRRAVHEALAGLTHRLDYMVEHQAALQAVLEGAIRQKADQAALDEGLRQKANQVALDEGLRQKADQAALDEGLRQKADQAALDEGLRQKADQATLLQSERRIIELQQSQSMAAHQQWNLQHAVLLRQVLDTLRERTAGYPPLMEAAVGEAAHDDFHWSLATAFRGSRDAVRERLHGYLDSIRDTAMRHPQQSLIDLGCGRGEWLELLRDSGMEAVGVDGNPLAVEFCRHLGMEVEQADILAYLKSCDSGAAAAITAFHIVEHLQPANLLTMLREAWRVLVPGGLLILETPNPENLQVATRMFYRDPTHRTPIPPELLEFMVQWAGFSDGRILRLSPYPESFHLPGDEPAVHMLNGLMFGPQDYAILARAG